MKKSEVIAYLKKNPDVLKGDFVVKPDVKTVRKTFEVEEKLVEVFITEARSRKLKIKDAIDQALRNWVGKK